jgi:N-acyl-D-amino-acid deacylase
MYDVLLKNGRIVDGTGNPWYRGDVAIQEGRIAAIGSLGPVDAHRTLDVAGKVVAPGFIDIHGHSDYLILANPQAENKIMQGITTDCAGNCGFSAAPIGDVWLQEWWVEDPLERFTVVSREEGREVLARHGIELDWSSLQEYYQRIEQRGTAINYCSFVGQVALRLAVTGEHARQPSAEELERMKSLLAEAMEQGALGVSTESGSHRGMDFSPEELIALCEVAASHGGRYSCDVGDFGAGLIGAVKEGLYVAEKADIPVILSHLLVYGLENSGKSRYVVKLIEEARERGVQVTADMFPYWFSESLHFFPLLNSLLPEWVTEGGDQAMLERLQDPEERARVKAELQEGKSSRWYVVPDRDEEEAYGKSPLKKEHWEETLLILSCRKGELYQNQTMDKIARSMGVDSFDALLNLLTLDPGTRKVFVSANQEDLRTFMAYPGTAFGTDGGLVKAILRPGVPNPVLTASFPHLLGQYVRQEKLLTLEDAVRKLTSLAAQSLGLYDRGLLLQGMPADVVVFDPDTVDGNPIYDPAADRHTAYLNKGIELVMVNGQVVLEGDTPTGALPGQVLRLND